ncbi:hypothetical protein, partial [Micrococcus sp. R8502A1]|uniref:hypothetical protein n=1 Tax=Micrococcus sp. R8502A1 TaxID=2583239 RepID=UPI001C6729D5
MTDAAQSLKHISEPTRPSYHPYAGFCLKKKKKKKKTHRTAEGAAKRSRRRYLIHLYVPRKRSHISDSDIYLQTQET